MFRCTQLSLGTKDDWVNIKVKAHDCGLLSLWLADCSREHVLSAPDIIAMDRVLAATMIAFRVIWLIYHSDLLLDLGERAQLEDARLTAFQGFNTLSADAAASGK